MHDAGGGATAGAAAGSARDGGNVAAGAAAAAAAAGDAGRAFSGRRRASMGIARSNSSGMAVSSPEQSCGSSPGATSTAIDGAQSMLVDAGRDSRRRSCSSAGGRKRYNGGGGLSRGDSQRRVDQVLQLLEGEATGKPAAGSRLAYGLARAADGAAAQVLLNRFPNAYTAAAGCASPGGSSVATLPSLVSADSLRSCASGAFAFGINAAAATCLSEWPLASSLCASPAKPSSLQRFGDAGAGGQTPDVYGQNPAAGGGAGSFSEEELDAAITAAEADETSFAVTAAAAAAARAEAAETEPAGGGSGRGAFAIAIDAAAFACLREWPLASSLCTSPAQPSSLRRDGNAADADGQSHAVGSGAGAVGISEAELDVAIAAVEADEAAATAMAVATAAAAAAAAAMAAAAEAVEAEAAMGAIAAGGWQQQAGLRFDDGSMERRYVEWQGLQAQKVGQSSAVQDACCARTGAAGCRAVTDSPKPR